jgi:hypothetical protein
LQLNAAVLPPPTTAAGNTREALVLKWGLLNKTTNVPLSTSAGIAPLAHRLRCRPGAEPDVR